MKKIIRERLKCCESLYPNHISQSGVGKNCLGCNRYCLRVIPFWNN